MDPLVSAVRASFCIVASIGRAVLAKDLIVFLGMILSSKVIGLEPLAFDFVV